MFRLRLDQKSDLNVPDYINSMGATTVVLVHHELPHGNPHYHAYIQLDVKENTLRQRIKRLGYVRPDFSIKKCDEQRKDEYIQYLFNQKHGNVPTLVSVINYDMDKLQELQNNAKSIAADYALRNNDERPSKPTVYQLAQEVKDELIQRFTRQRIFNHREATDASFAEMYEAAINIAIQTCHKYNQPFEEHYLKRLITTALSFTETGKEGIIRKIMHKEFSY